MQQILLADVRFEIGGDTHFQVIANVDKISGCQHGLEALSESAITSLHCLCQIFLELLITIYDTKFLLVNSFRFDLNQLLPIIEPLKVEPLVDFLRDLLEQIFNKAIALDIDNALQCLIDNNGLLRVERLNKVQRKTQKHETSQILALDGLHFCLRKDMIDEQFRVLRKASLIVGTAELEAMKARVEFLQ